MIACTVDKNAVALIIEENESARIKDEVNRCLIKQGYKSWPDMEAELYCYKSHTMVIARPLSPLVRRFQYEPVRLKRS